jgi:hypothetical protein
LDRRREGKFRHNEPTAFLGATYDLRFLGGGLRAGWEDKSGKIFKNTNSAAAIVRVMIYCSLKKRATIALTPAFKNNISDFLKYYATASSIRCVS